MRKHETRKVRPRRSDIRPDSSGWQTKHESASADRGSSDHPILVAGCAGFIGARVCETLLHRNHTVTGIDNMNDAYDVRLKEWRLKRLQAQEGFVFHLADITDRRSLEEVLTPYSSHNAPCAVINLAARAGVRRSVDNPWEYYRDNLTGTLNLLELCRGTGVRKFVQASSSSVYGSPDGSNPMPHAAFAETASSDRPLSPYAASKKAAEALCYTYHHLHGLDVSVLRYFTVYGPAGRPDMSIFRFIRWISEGQPVILYGDGRQERDFTFVDDIARGTVAALRPIGYEIINLGSDRPESVCGVISRLEAMIRKPACIDRQPPDPSDVATTWAEISKARGLLDWSPQTSLEEGLERSVAWYMDNRAWARSIRL